MSRKKIDLEKGKAFAVSADGESLFVKSRKSGIPSLIAICDGLPLVKFGNEKTAYHRVTDVIDWYKKELKHYRNRGDSEEKDRLENNLGVIEMAYKKFLDGDIVDG